MTVNWDSKAVRGITSSPEATQHYLDLGWQVAEVAAVLAPKSGRPNGGASSIHPEVVMVDGHPEVHVGYDRKFFYLGFAETGTEHQKATPFLRPAMARFQ